MGAKEYLKLNEFTNLKGRKKSSTFNKNYKVTV